MSMRKHEADRNRQCKYCGLPQREFGTHPECTASPCEADYVDERPRFSDKQRDRLRIRRIEGQNPSVVLDFYAAYAILVEGLEDFWVAVRTTDKGKYHTGLIALVSLAARCQQAAEDLNLIDKETRNPDAEARHEKLVELVRSILRHIQANGRPVAKPSQRGKEEFQFTFDESWIHDTLEKLDNANLFPPARPHTL